MRRRIALTAAAAVALTGSLVMVGCGSEYNRMGEFSGEPTPSLMTLGSRPVDVQGELSRTGDTNERLFWQDMGVFGLTDRPSRLHNVPTPY
jgi:hypothetical protein